MSYVKYNVFDVVNIKDNRVGTQLLDKLTRIKDDRRLEPLDYDDNIAYQHRAYYDSYNLQIGDSCFMVPPEFIMITSESASQSIVTLRQENTQKQKNGYHRRIIMIDLVFNGLDQINGFRVKGPESVDGKDYYVDGLRPLMAQFKCTPFLPITNELINGTYGIFTVALQSINISTMPGYPEVMKAQIILQEVCMFPYIEQPDFNFQFLIDWDLFRYYYQSFMTETHKYKRLQSLPKNKDYNKFKISVLDSNIFDEDSITEYNILQVVLDNKIVREDSSTNYTTWIDNDTSDVVITSFQCGYSNILTNIQMAELSAPTIQFLGGMDTIYNITFETTDEKVVQALEQSQITNDLVIRSNPKIRSSIGFVKLESELVEFTGSLFVMIESVETNTVPGFPGLYNIQINCVAYDVAQSERESLHGFKPFDCDKCGDDWYSDCEHSEQAIDQERKGWKTKIKQDNYAEWKLRTSIEVYPDLRLPTYNEVNNIINKIAKFRKDNELSELPYNEYPTRPAIMLHGYNPKGSVSYDYIDEDNTMIDILSIKREEYHGYVDPDFYVFYPNSYESYLDEDPEYYSAFNPVQMEGYKKTKVMQNLGIYTESGTPLSTNIENFIQLATSFDGCEYVLGSVGDKKGSNGLPTFDCSGLIIYCMRYMGILPDDIRFTTSTVKNYTEYFEEVPLENAKRGDLLWRSPSHKYSSSGYGHIVIYLGNERIFHAASTKKGVRFDDLNRNAYECALRIRAFYQTSSGGDIISSYEEANEKYENMVEFSDALESALTITPGSSLTSLNNYQNFLNATNGTSAKKQNIIPMVDYVDPSKPSTGQFYLTQEFVDMVKKWEGYLSETKPLDGGLDIGYGMHNIYYDENYNECKVVYGMSWTEEEAEKYLKIRLQIALDRTINNIKNAGWNINEFTNNQVLALTSYFFNRGEGNKKAKAILNKANNPTIADIGNSLPDYWGSGANKPVKGLVERRKKEQSFFFSNSNGVPVGTITGIESLNIDIRFALVQSELDAICRTVMSNTLGEDSNSEKAFAQHLYDKATTKDGVGKLSTILSVYGTYDGDLSETVMDIVKGVFLENNKYNEKAMLYCLKIGDDALVEIDRYDQQHKRLCEVNTHIYWGTKDSLNSSKQLFTLVDSKDNIKSEDTTEEELEIGVFTLESSERFGEPVVIDTEYYRQFASNPFGGKNSGNDVAMNWRDSVNTTENSFNTAFCDMCQYSSRGRLVKAFPTYLFCILDDDANWFDGRKLWTNYYTHQSVVDISVHGTNDMPTETATILVNNSYHNLDRTQGGLSEYSIMNDDEYSTIAKTIYKNTNILVSGGKFGPRLTKKLIQLHQILYAHGKLREGARVHLRMGYGSDPLSLAPVMNGHISEVALGDQIQIIVTSDAHELLQHVVSAKEGDSNNGWLGIFGIGEKQESSNIIADIMCKRSSWMTYLSKGSFEMSKYSIEHYGLFERQNLLSSEGDEGISGAGGAIIGGVIGGAIAAGAVLTGGLSLIPSVLITTAGTAVGGTIGAIAGSDDISISDLWNEYIEQYDICKNLYRASYRRTLYCHNDVDGTPGDGEMNIVFTKYNMTPWDMFQMCTQQVPEYIMKSSYHQFDSRLYFGLPFWMEKYRYDILKDKDGNEKIVEECKTASQVHFLDSMDNIIDNQLRVTSRHSFTNIKVMYLRGSSAVSTMEIHSDDTIDMSKQKTKILDTPIVQDAIGPDLLWEILQYNVGDDAARRVGISNLLYAWQQQYQGEIITLGNPGVKPHDYLMVNDTYINLFGISIVREVTHSFNTNTGFTTSIIPGMLGFSTDENSGMIEPTKSLLSLLSCFASYTSTRRNMYQNYEATLNVWGDAAALISIARSRFNSARNIQIHQTVQGVGSFVSDILMIKKMSKSFWRGCSLVGDALKGAEYLKNGVDIAKTFDNFKDTIKFTSKFKNIVKGMRAAFTGGTIAAAPATGGLSIIVGAVINTAIWLTADVLLASALEYFSNKNVCILCPFWWEGSPFVSGVKDGEKILLFPSPGTDENTGQDAFYKDESSQEDN